MAFSGSQAVLHRLLWDSLLVSMSVPFVTHLCMTPRVNSACMLPSLDTACHRVRLHRFLALLDSHCAGVFSVALV